MIFRPPQSRCVLFSSALHIQSSHPRSLSSSIVSPSVLLGFFGESVERENCSKEIGQQTVAATKWAKRAKYEKTQESPKLQPNRIGKTIVEREPERKKGGTGERISKSRQKVERIEKKCVRLFPVCFRPKKGREKKAICNVPRGTKYFSFISQSSFTLTSLHSEVDSFRQHISLVPSMWRSTQFIFMRQGK